MQREIGTNNAPANMRLRMMSRASEESGRAHIPRVFECAPSAAHIRGCAQVENMTLTCGARLTTRAGNFRVANLHSQSTREPAGSNHLDRYTALITAGGIGTRLLPFSKEIPKEMLPIIAHDGDDSPELKPLVQAIFEQLYSAGVRDFYIVVGRGKRAIEDHFSPDPRFLAYLEKNGKVPKGISDFYEKIKSSKLVFLNQPEPLGFGDAVLLGRSMIDGPFIVQAADTFILSDGTEYLERLTELHRRYDASATVLLREVPDPRNYGVVDGNELEPGVLQITSAVEKPETPRSHHAIMPVYVFAHEIFEALSETEPGRDGEVQLTDAIQCLVAAGERVIGVNLSGDEVILDLGSPETMIAALKLSLQHADERAHADPEIARTKRGTPRRGEPGIGKQVPQHASLPALVPMMIEWRTAHGREAAPG